MFPTRICSQEFSKIALLMTLEAREAHSYAFRDMLEESGIPFGVFTNEQAPSTFSLRSPRGTRSRRRN